MKNAAQIFAVAFVGTLCACLAALLVMLAALPRLGKAGKAAHVLRCVDAAKLNNGHGASREMVAALTL